MRRLLSILFLLWICCVARGANPAFTDFNPTQFSTAGNKISLNNTVPTTNVTVINLYSSTNISVIIFATNITAQSIFNVTNISQTTFVTNFYSSYSFISNFFANYFTVYSNANIVGYVRDYNGISTNQTLYGAILVAPVYVVNSNGIAFQQWFSNQVVIAQIDGTNGFVGSFVGLVSSGSETNAAGSRVAYLSDIGSIPGGSSFGWIVVTNGITNLLAVAAAPSVAWFDVNGMLTNPPPQTANQFFGGPVSAGPSVPTFRSLANRDLLSTSAARTDLVNSFSLYQSFTSGLTSTAVTNTGMTTVGVVTNNASGAEGTTTIVPAPFLGTSTANSTTVLYGDNVWRNPTNAGVTIPTTVISTNWVLNQTYTNSYGTAIQVDASVALHGAAVSGSAAMDLYADQQNNGSFTLQDRVAVSTILTSIVTDYTNSLACILTNLARFYFTNSSTGVGNLSSIVPATGQLTIFGDVFAAGVVGQNRTLTINGTANQITVTGGSQDLSADRAWTASISAAPQFNGQNVTNVLLSDLTSPTNGVSSATAIDFSVPEATTNITANIAFTSIINFNSTNYNYAIRHIIVTGGNFTETVGTGWRTDPNARTTVNTYTMTNNCVIDMLFEAQINQFTNAFILFASP